MKIELNLEVPATVLIGSIALVGNYEVVDHLFCGSLLCFGIVLVGEFFDGLFAAEEHKAVARILLHSMRHFVR